MSLFTTIVLASRACSRSRGVTNVPIKKFIAGHALFLWRAMSFGAFV
jgi:hypothetical protein